MKATEKKKAQKLRKEGYSLGEIARQLGVSKGSVSIWVRDVHLTERQKERLGKNSHAFETVEKRRRSRLKNEDQRRQLIIDAAHKEIGDMPHEALFMIGVSLYWAEGSKTRRGVVEFSNSDPRLIRIMMRFFKEACGVPEAKFRGHVYLHPHLNAPDAENYWSSVSAIPKAQFFKTAQQHNRASKNKKDSLPNGTFSICICSTELFLKIKGWSEGMSAALLD